MAATARKVEIEESLAGPEDLVKLDPDHPGFRDETYRRRRNEIARLALAYRLGDPLPEIAYTPTEHCVWRAVWSKLGPLHARRACAGYLTSAAGLAIDHARIPQLAEVNLRLEPLTGFRLLPVAGLVTSRNFLGSLAKGIFLSTQYIRHESRPLYTPEPDVVHELIGHACTLRDPMLARLNRLFGAVAAKAPKAKLPALERLYWYSLEFGLLEERGELRAYGAGLLSSYGELGRYDQSAFISPFDPDECAARPYDPTDYQAILYVVPSLEWLDRRLRHWFSQHL
jgi:phenylalanine-4-hydroxylase